MSTFVIIGFLMLIKLVRPSFMAQDFKDMFVAVRSHLKKKMCNDSCQKRNFANLFYFPMSVNHNEDTFKIKRGK